MRKSRLGWTALGVLAALGTLGLALDGLHYWHDVRFLFATSQLPFSEVLDGRFNPHQSWGPIDESGSAGFYTSKVLHLWLLNRLFALVAPSPGGLRLAVALSVAMMIAAAACGGVLIGRITGSKPLGWTGFVSVLLVPVTPYLAGKQLSEVTSLALAVWGLLVAWAALQDHGRGAVSVKVMSAAALLLAAVLCRLDSAFGPVGFFIAAWWFAEERAARRKTAMVAGAVGAVVGLGYVAALALIGGSVRELHRYLFEFVAAPNKPALMSALGIASFGGVLYAVAAAAVFSHRRRAVGFFFSWWMITWLPSVLITSAFMIEPRYLVQGVVPIAALASLGLEAIRRRLHSRWVPRIAVAGLLVILAANWVTIRLMPYELDRPALLSAVDEIEAQSPGAAILVPWAYTDFNFLYVMRPSASVYSVHSPTEPDVSAKLVEAWHDRYRSWYGRRHLAKPSELAELLDDGPVYYLGWHIYPPLAFVERTADRLGFQALSSHLHGIDLIDHLETSWVPESAELRLEFAGRVGQYEYFHVRATRP